MHSLLLHIGMLLQQQAQQIDWAEVEGYLWLAGTGLLLVLLAAALALVFVRRYRDELSAFLSWLDDRASTLAPGLWRAMRRRFSLRAWHGLSLTVAALLILVLTYGFVEVTDGWMNEEALYRIDRGVAQALQGTLTAATITLFRWLTYTADFRTVLILSLGIGTLLLLRKERWRLLALVLAFGAGQGVLWLMKWGFGRARPEGHLTSAAGGSFPSGHTFTGTVFYGFLIYLVWRWTPRRWLRYTATLLLTLLILGIALSRVVLSVHWVSDVLGGLLVGLAWLLCSLIIARAVQEVYGSPPRVASPAGDV